MKKCCFILFLLVPVLARAQIINTYAGGGTTLGDGGSATTALISDPTGLIFDNRGDMYVVSKAGERIRLIDTMGLIHTVAGVGISGSFGNGSPATAAQFNGPEGIALDRSGNIYITDAGNNKIRKINLSTGVITTIAGTGSPGYTGDGFQATAAELYNPLCICFNKNGDLFFTDEQNNCVRKIDTSGIITRFAGTTVYGYNGDGIPATNAQLWLPWGITADTVGNIYISDNGNYRIRKVDTSGIITTFAGTGLSDIYNGDNIAATSAQFDPGQLTMDPYGNLYICEEPYNYRVRQVDTAGIIHTVVGNGIAGHSGDGGPATSSEIDYPGGITFDACGNLYVSDIGYNRIRKVSYPPIISHPTISITATTPIAVGSTVTVTATVSNAGTSYIIYWMNHGSVFTTTTVPSVTYTKTAGTDTITAKVVSTASYGCYDSTVSAGYIVSSLTTQSGMVTQQPVYIYPNPVGNGSLNIENEKDNTSYQLSTVVGAVVQQGSLQQGNNSISLQSLPPGLYILELTDGSGNKTVNKIIKE